MSTSNPVEEEEFRMYKRPRYEGGGGQDNGYPGGGGFTGIRERTAGTIPYGTQRSLDMAIALATDPSLLLLDEPTSGDDTPRIPSK